MNRVWPIVRVAIAGGLLLWLPIRAINLDLTAWKLPLPNYYLRGWRNQDQTWAAVDLPHHGHPGVSRGGVPAIEASSSDSRNFVFGPYVPIIAGRYQLTIRGEMDAATGSVLQVELAHDTGRRIVANWELSVSDLGKTTEFDLPSMRDLEIRLTATSHESVRVTSVTLVREQVFPFALARSMATDTEELFATFFRTKVY